MRRLLIVALPLVTFAALAVGGGSAVAQSKRLPVKEVVDKMQGFYEKIQDLKADFKQQVKNPTTGRTKESLGVVKLKKPGKMRWDYTKPEKKHFISDGSVLWVYEPEDQQAFKQEMKSTNLSAAVTFLSGKGKLAEEFTFELLDAAKYGSKADYAVKLTPKQPSAQFKHIVLVVDPATFQAKQSIVTTPDGGESRVWFSGVALNKKIPDSEFKFTPPSGVRVIISR
jgi:outer membrane lipoprotein carrier protein